MSDRRCIACGGDRETIGVAYGEGLPDPFGRQRPAEIKFWCARCLPDEFRPPKREPLAPRVRTGGAPRE